MTYKWIMIFALIVAVFIFGFPILFSVLNLLELSESLDLLAIFFSWPIATVIIGLFFMGRFHAAIDSLLKNIGSMKFPGGIEIQRQDQPPLINEKAEVELAPEAKTHESVEMLDEVSTDIQEDQQITEEDVKQLRDQYQQVAFTARWWKFAYLNLFFVPQTKNVLSWFSRSAPQSRLSYDTLWTPFILDQNQRNAILSVLLQNGMLIEEGGLVRISEEGFGFLQFIGYIPIAPPQQGI